MVFNFKDITSPHIAKNNYGPSDFIIFRLACVRIEYNSTHS
jgi:hypothetical protein